MKQFIQILSLLLILFSFTATAQQLKWSYSAEGSGNLQVLAMQQVSPALFLTGVFSDSVQSGADMLQSKGMNDVFLAKMDDSGQVLWSKSFGSKGDDMPAKIVSDNGLIFLGGKVAGNQTENLETADDKTSLFIKSVDGQGKWQWDFLAPFAGRATLDVLTPAPGNTLFTGGMFRGCIRIDGKEYCSTAADRAYYMLLSQEGSLLEFFTSEGTGNHRTIAARFDRSGNLYLMSAAGKGSYTLQSGSKNRMHVFESEGLVIAKYSPEIHQLWSIPVIADAYLEGIELLCDTQGNIFAGVNFGKTITIADKMIESKSRLSTALIKLDTDGNVIAVNTLESSVYCRLMDMNLMNDEDLLLTGYYHGEIAMEDTEIRSPKDNRTAFVMLMDGHSGIVWSDELSFGTEGYGRALSSGDSGDLLLAGGFSNLSAVTDGYVGAFAQTSGIFINSYKLGQPEKEDEKKQKLIDEEETAGTVALEDEDFKQGAIENASVETTTNYQEESLQNEFLVIFPNPVTDQLHWSFNSPVKGEFTVEVCDSGGALLYSKTYQAGAGSEINTVNMRHYNSGIYLFRLQVGGVMLHRVIVKQ
ncbi:MAG: T9SS type A sorting domain-containing protein [Bacteroidales bacterium]|nr:T9SS type A sorting domain-containing protein [Bacteroidales bacterium]